MIVPEATETERTLEPHISVSGFQRLGDKSSIRKRNARVSVTDLKKEESRRSPTNGHGTLGRQAQWEPEDEKRAERRRLRMLSDGHPERCNCLLCQGAASVQKSLWDETDEK